MNKYQLNPENAVLVLVDFQERLMPAMEDHEALGERAARLVRGIRALGLPILVTQQYTRGLGETVSILREALGEFSPIEKTSFSCAGEPAFLDALRETGRRQVILAGIETHVCVAQTALSLLELGFHVFLVRDCISSRRVTDRQTALDRMVQAGVFPATYEAVLFELLGNAKAPAFKEISGIVK